MKKLLAILAIMVIAMTAYAQDHDVIRRNAKFSGQVDFVTKSKKIAGNPIWNYKPGTMWHLTSNVVGDDIYVEFYIETPDGLHREIMQWRQSEAVIVVFDPNTNPSYTVMNDEYSFLTIMPNKKGKYIVQIVTQ